MSRIRSRLSFALATSATVGAIALAGAGASALATTPTPPIPTPTPTPTPTPLPTAEPTQLCVAPAPGSTRLQSRITVNTNADGSRVSLSWGIAGSTGGFPDLCVINPTAWDVFVDGEQVADVFGFLGGGYVVTGLPVGSTHTFKVVPTNNSNLSTLTRTITIEAGYTDPPFVPEPDATPTPTPTPLPPTPTLATLCSTPIPNLPSWHGRTLDATPNAAGDTVELSWRTPSSCLLVPNEWTVDVDGARVAIARGFLSGDYTVTGLDPSVPHTFRVTSITNPGKLGSLATTLPAGPHECVTPPEGAPNTRNPVVTAAEAETVDGASVAAITWRPPYGCGPRPAQYEIFLNGQSFGVQPASGPTTKLIAGLAPGRRYDVRVESTDTSGGLRWGGSSFTTPVAPTPTPTPSPTATPVPTNAFKLTGGLGLRTKSATGSFALNGSATLRDAGSQLDGSFTTAPSGSTLRLAAIIPIKATVALSNGRLTADNTPDRTATDIAASASLAITKATVLGVTLTQNGTCRAVAPLTIPMTPNGGFSFTSGGRLSGTFNPGAFTGCGPLGNFLGTTSAKSTLGLALSPSDAHSAS